MLTVVGPTACGKTGRAVALAKAFDGEIISGDSRQVYRGMDLGTGKDIDEYGDIKHHLIDVADAGEKYNLHRFIQDFRQSLDLIRKKGKRPIFCGGSGMYVETALSGIDLPEVEENPELRKSLDGKSLEELTEILKSFKSLHNTTDTDTQVRAIRAIEIETYYRDHPEAAKASDRRTATPVDSLIIGINIPRDERRRRISERLDRRLEAGMIDEVRGLIAAGVEPEKLIYYGLEYKYLTLHVIGELSFNEMRSQLETAIHQFAKRQMTWWRGMERRGFTINWLPYDLSETDFTARVSALLGQ